MNANLYSTVLAAHVSEKSVRIGDANRQYVFKVIKDANKQTVKQAVELLFKVNVTKVNILNVKPKKKIFRGRHGSRKAWKKAYITLQEGQEIKFLGNE